MELGFPLPSEGGARGLRGSCSWCEGERGQEQEAPLPGINIRNPINNPRTIFSVSLGNGHLEISLVHAQDASINTYSLWIKQYPLPTLDFRM